MVDDPVEVASPGRFAVYMGNDITVQYPRKVGGTAGHQLTYLDTAVGEGNSVYADPAEIREGIAGMGGEERQHQQQECCKEASDHG
jgi:hypothetical protein